MEKQEESAFLDMFDDAGFAPGVNEKKEQQSFEH